MDLIHSNMEVVLDGGLAARLTGIPHVLHYRGNTVDEPKRVFDVLTRLWTTLSDQIFCISHRTAEIFVRRGLGRKVEALYDPIQVRAFAEAERSRSVRADLGASDGDLLVATVARLHPRKDIETFLRASAQVARAVPASRFAVVGAAPDVASEPSRKLRAPGGARG